MPCSTSSPAPFLEKATSRTWFSSFHLYIGVTPSFILSLHLTDSQRRDFQVTECYFVQKSAAKSWGGKVACCLICILFLFVFYLPETGFGCCSTKCWLMHILTVFHNSFLHIYLSATVLVKRNNSHFVRNENTKHPLILLFPKTLIFDPSQRKKTRIFSHQSAFQWKRIPNWCLFFSSMERGKGYEILPADTKHLLGIPNHC